MRLINLKKYVERKVIMKKVTAFVGSAQRHNTYHAVVQFLNYLQALGDVEVEIVTLSDYKLGICRGCRLCFERGEEFCPLKDDRDVLMNKITASDGVVFASPNYCWHVSGIMKTFLDRFGFICHRPRYFGKAFTSIVTQGFTGGNKIVDYFDFLANFLGFNTVKGASLTTLDPRTEKAQKKIDIALSSLSRRFYAKLAKPAYPEPSLFKLMGFRMARTSIIELLDDRSRDYRYFAEKGWLESDYYYPTHMGLLKTTAGRLFDSMTPTIRNMIS
jgi:multimeric flavodoxin WrbA